MRRAHAADPIESLRGHREFVRRMVEGLIAAESPPRSWLGGFVRKLRRRVRPGGAVDRALHGRGVLDAVLDLDETLRATVLMRYYDGLPVTEIARRCGASVDVVRERLERARRVLRPAVEV